jgi:hypothetical protein
VRAPRAPLAVRHFQRRRRGIFVVYHPPRFKLRRSGIFGLEFPDDVAPDGALTVLELRIYNDASPTGFEISVPSVSIRG